MLSKTSTQEPQPSRLARSHQLTRTNSGTNPSYATRHVEEIPPQEPDGLCDLQVAEDQGK